MSRQWTSRLEYQSRGLVTDSGKVSGAPSLSGRRYPNSARSPLRSMTTASGSRASPGQPQSLSLTIPSNPCSNVDAQVLNDQCCCAISLTRSPNTSNTPNTHWPIECEARGARARSICVVRHRRASKPAARHEPGCVLPERTLRYYRALRTVGASTPVSTRTQPCHEAALPSAHRSSPQRVPVARLRCGAPVPQPDQVIALESSRRGRAV